MKTGNMKAIIIIGITGLFTAMITIFSYSTDTHKYAVHIGYIAIILTVLWKRKWLPFVLSYIVLFHMIADSIELSGFPLDAAIESLIQIGIALVLY